MYTRVLALVALLAGCSGGVEVGTGGATGSTGGGGSAATATAGGSSGASGSSSSGGSGGTTTEPVCPEAEPPGCAMPDKLLAFDHEAPVADVLGPILPWEASGASIACLGPFEVQDTVSQVLLGFLVPPPDGSTMLIDTWVQPTPDATGHAFTWTACLMAGAEPTPADLVMVVYEVPKLSGPPGHYTCVAVPLSSYLPPATEVTSCERPMLAQWLGLPWHDDNGDGKATAEELTVAPLACPADTTTDDGTPAVDAWHVQLPIGVR